MEENVRENQAREESPAGEIPADEVEVRVDPGEFATRPLSQFILSKEYAGVSANPELIRPVTLVAATQPVGERREEPVAATTRRIEYPFYDDDDESDDLPVPAEAVEPEAVGPEAVGTEVVEPEVVEPEVVEPEPVAAEIEAVPAEEPEVLELAAERPVTLPPPAEPIERDDPIPPIRPPRLLVSYGAVSADEASSPLPGARGRREQFPLLDFFLNALSPRRRRGD